MKSGLKLWLLDIASMNFMQAVHCSVLTCWRSADLLYWSHRAVLIALSFSNFHFSVVCTVTTPSLMVELQNLHQPFSLLCSRHFVWSCAQSTDISTYWLENFCWPDTNLNIVYECKNNHGLSSRVIDKEAYKACQPHSSENKEVRLIWLQVMEIRVF